MKCFKRLLALNTERAEAERDAGVIVSEDDDDDIELSDT